VLEGEIRDIGPAGGPLEDLDETRKFQFPDGLPDDHTADLELFGQFPFRWHLFPRLVFTRKNSALELGHHLFRYSGLLVDGTEWFQRRFLKISISCRRFSWKPGERPRLLSPPFRLFSLSFLSPHLLGGQPGSFDPYAEKNVDGIYVICIMLDQSPSSFFPGVRRSHFFRWQAPGMAPEKEAPGSRPGAGWDANFHSGGGLQC